jgi:Ser/Thr protein kinase RdoA (MazF antagonist)
VRAVIQRLHPIFAAEVNLDIEAVTEHLAAGGIETPRLLRTRAGEAWLAHPSGFWRALSYVDGVSHPVMPDAAHARAAGELVGRFHRALAGLDRRFQAQRVGVHDTAAHLGRLAGALGAAPPPGPQDSATATLLDEARDLARRILEAGVRLAPHGDLPRRVCHGDLKISNVRFAAPPAVAARCLIDLDTLGWQTIAYELGDGLRSWCNPEGEDTERPRFDKDTFAAALGGYAAGARGLLSPAEVGAILPGVETVAVELAARFCLDVFEDRYFGWSADRFASRRHHNLVRARGQLALAHTLGQDRAATTAAVRREFGG